MHIPLSGNVPLLVTLGLLVFGLIKSFIEFRRAASVGRGWRWLLESWKFDLLQLATVAALGLGTWLVYSSFPAVIGNSFAAVAVPAVLLGSAWLIMRQLEAARDRARNSIIARQ